VNAPSVSRTGNSNSDGIGFELYPNDSIVKFLRKPGRRVFLEFDQSNEMFGFKSGIFIPERGVRS
jgi:hypothetical protein